MSDKRISYFYDTEGGNFHYGSGHPMKPHRIAVTHNLVFGYNLHTKMSLYRPYKASAFDMCRFHTPDYINFLERVTPQVKQSFITSVFYRAVRKKLMTK